MLEKKKKLCLSVTYSGLNPDAQAQNTDKKNDRAPEETIPLSMTVYSFDKVTFLFKDGSKVEWKIEK